MGRKQQAAPPRNRCAKRQSIAAQALRGAKSQIGQQNRTVPKNRIGKEQNSQKLQQQREQLRRHHIGRNRGLVSTLSLTELAGRATQSAQIILDRLSFGGFAATNLSSLNYGGAFLGNNVIN
ncbi:hypothetical protein CCR75_006288 [Bremia lactucae]|uniref:Uncharacterized protein n=1 Tax=Bremia lactucae TaxID=4779 RepID=A0A976IFW8_BRELC|nr:hypothetical protein CCR75_006288 [Bremia lactucae]